MPACNLHKAVEPSTEDILIKNVDPVLLEKQRMLLRDALDAINHGLDPGKERLSALIGVINMLDAWSDERARNR